jgi:hypothetical protein
MDRRKVYKLVAELLPAVGGAQELLNDIADIMRGRKSGEGYGDLQSLFTTDDALGRIYQAINAPALEAAYRATAKDRRKFSAGEIPAVTQLFTPKWVVRFLLENTLGKLWGEMHMGGTPMPRRAIDLRICDPACGTMNFGLVALDMLREMYRQEIANAGKPGWPGYPSCNQIEDIDAAIVRNNLIGFDIDPTAIELARLSLEIKIKRPIADGDHRLFVRDAMFDQVAKSEFDVVVTNPPYLSARNLDPGVVRRLKSRYPTAWRDLYASFVLRSLELLRPGGRAGILAMQSFMFTAAFEKMRRKLRDSADVETVAHFGPGLFEIGNPGTLQTAAVVLRSRPSQQHPAIFYRLINQEDKQSALKNAIAEDTSKLRFELSQDDLNSSPRSAWMYWITPAIRRVFAEFPKLGEISPPRQGLATTDNMRFVRYWWEVEPPGFSGERNKWLPYAKGGRFRRWHESPRHRVNWENDGREIKAEIVRRYPYLNGQWQWVAKNSGWYGREGITYSYLTSGSFSARKLDAGAIFDVAGSSLFPDDPLPVLGVLNSSVAARLLAAINPTVNFQVGDLRQLPMPRSFPDSLRNEVASAIESTRALDRFDETSVDFVEPEPWVGDERHRHNLADAEWKIDQIVAELYGVAPESSGAIQPILRANDPHPNPPPEYQGRGFKTEGGSQNQTDWPTSPIVKASAVRTELARRWISYALGNWLGRWGGRDGRRIAELSPLDPILARFIRDMLGPHCCEIESVVGGLERFFAREFLSWHNRIYRFRPVFWGFSAGGKTVAVSQLTADGELMRLAFHQIGENLPVGWRRHPDDGTAINLAPLAPWIADRKLQTVLREVLDDLRQARHAFSGTARSISQGLTAESARVRRRNLRKSA